MCINYSLIDDIIHCVCVFVNRDAPHSAAALDEENEPIFRLNGYLTNQHTYNSCAHSWLSKRTSFQMCKCQTESDEIWQVLELDKLKRN